jgi:hypothetical protein
MKAITKDSNREPIKHRQITAVISRGVGIIAALRIKHLQLRKIKIKFYVHLLRRTYKWAEFSKSRHLKIHFELLLKLINFYFVKKTLNN